MERNAVTGDKEVRMRDNSEWEKVEQKKEGTRKRERIGGKICNKIRREKGRNGTKDNQRSKTARETERLTIKEEIELNIRHI